ncbi:MAG: hypothetical protein R3C68_18940 [Myxococcota bacterium]
MERDDHQYGAMAHLLRRLSLIPVAVSTTEQALMKLTQPLWERFACP